MRSFHNFDLILSVNVIPIKYDNYIEFDRVEDSLLNCICHQVGEFHFSANL